jgi:hypothetical protein
MRTPPRSTRSLIRRGAGALAACALAGAGALVACGHTLPTGLPGPEAEALAHRMAAAVHADAWARTGAVRFRFRGDTEHLWDKTRNLARVTFLRSGEVVLLDVARRDGRAYENGRELTGAPRQKLITRAWERFCNDTFWLNPLVKLFDDGVTRSRVVDKDGESLIVHYAAGGVTPGDSYQWLVGEHDLPRAWRMFVKIIPVKGLEISWGGWLTLQTGAVVATEHRALRLDAVRIRDAVGAATLAELEPGPDPFAAIR